jgi:hypothetical protein
MVNVPALHQCIHQTGDHIDIRVRGFGHGRGHLSHKIGCFIGSHLCTSVEQKISDNLIRMLNSFEEFDGLGRHLICDVTYARWIMRFW